MRRLAALALLAALCAWGAGGGEALAAPLPFVSGRVPAPATCRLEAWPARPIDAVTQGDLWNHAVNQAFDPARGGVARPDVLAPEGQRRLLEQADLPGLFRLEGASTIVHPGPPAGARPVSAASPRLSAGEGCAVELVVVRLFYDRAALAGRSLKSLLVIRRFGDGPEVLASYSGWGETALARFPPGKGDDLAAADAELQDAYLANLRQFAARAAIAPDAKGRRPLPAAPPPPTRKLPR
jgi:hypothetical protein